MWPQLPQQLRSPVADEDAEHALIEPKLPNLTSAEQFYKDEPSYFWSQVCLTAVDVSVRTSGSRHGRQPKAGRVGGCRTHSGSAGRAAPLGNGARYCLSPEQLIMQPAVFRQLVYGWPRARRCRCPKAMGTRWSRCGRGRSSPSMPRWLRSSAWWPRRRPYRLDVASPGRRQRYRPHQDPESGRRQGRPDLRFVDDGTAVAAYIPQVWPAGQATP